MHAPSDITCTPRMPQTPAPIVVLGAGGIVRDAHLPAYRKAGFEVLGIWNRTRAKAEKLAHAFGIPRVFDTVDDAVRAAPERVVWDLAVMPPQFPAILDRLPAGSHALLQKPMGDDWGATLAIRDACWRHRHHAAVNCQLRFAPYCLAARDLIRRGLIGELHHMTVHVEVYTPWHLFPHIHGLPRAEIQQHSIHYLDLVRSFAGDPTGVYARTVQHPDQTELASTRTTMMLEYGQGFQATVFCNHGHKYGHQNESCYIKWEGSRGAIKARIGLLLDYPRGAADRFEVCLLDRGGRPRPGDRPTWEALEIPGSWFPDAFIGTMAEVQRHLENPDAPMETSIEDVMRTMACVEAAYRSDAGRGEPVDYSCARRRCPDTTASSAPPPASPEAPHHEHRRLPERRQIDQPPAGRPPCSPAR